LAAVNLVTGKTLLCGRETAVGTGQRRVHSPDAMLELQLAKAARVTQPMLAESERRAVVIESRTWPKSSCGM
jgi:hypothetical protein